MEKIFDTPDIGEGLKSAVTKITIGGETYPNEVVFEIGDIIVKQYIETKQQGTIDEFEALNLLEKIGIDAPKPVARIFTGKGQAGFVAMEKLKGISGRELEKYIPETMIDDFRAQAFAKMQDIAHAVRRDAGIDKPWKLEDFMFEYTINEETNEVTILRMVPIDFEQVQIFDPANPCSIEGEVIIPRININEEQEEEEETPEEIPYDNFFGEN